MGLAINVGGIETQLDLNTAKFEQKLKMAQTNMDKFGNQMKSLSDKAGSLGKKMTTSLTLPIAGLGAMAIKVGAEFEKGMSQVMAISGATGQEMKELETLARDMGATTKFSASEAAEGLKYMAMAGWDATQMTKALPAVLDLAAASGEDLGLVSDIVTDSLTAFGLSAEDAIKFTDLLANTATNSNTNVTMMGETFKYVAPLFGSLGYKAEDAALATGLMANAGIKGGQAGTALRAAITNLIEPTKDGAVWIEQLGISMTDADGNMKPFDETIGQLRKSFKDLTEEQQAQAASQLFGKEAMSGMLAIINTSEEDYNKLTKATTDYNGAAKEMADIMGDNLEGQIVKLKSGLEGLGIQIFEVLVPYLISLTKKIQEIVKSFSRLSPEMRKTIVKIGALVAGIGPLILVMGKLGGVLTSGVKFIGMFKGAIGVMTTGAVAATPAIGGMATALTFLPGPVGIAIMAVAGLTAGLGYLAIKHRNTTEVTEEAIERNREFANSVDDTTTAIEGNIEARKEQLVNTEADMIVTQELIDQLFALTNQENLSAEEKERAKSLMDEINGRQQALTFEMNEYSGALNYSEEQVQGLMDKELERIERVVAADLIAENLKDQYKAEKELKTALDEKNRLLEEQEAKVKAVYEKWKDQENIDRAVKEIMEDYAEPLGIVNEKTEELTGKTNELNIENAELQERLKDPAGWKAVQDEVDNTTTKYDEHASTTEEFHERYANINKIGGENAGTALSNGVQAGMVGFAERMELKGSEAGEAVGTGLHTGEAGAIMAADKLRSETVKAFEPTHRDVARIAGEMKDDTTGKTIEMKDDIVLKFTELKDQSIERINQLKDDAIALPGKIADGIRRGADAVKRAFVEMWNSVVRGISGPVNMVIKGANWILDKFGADQISLWEPTYYGKGTDGHLGGPAIINDQKGSTYREAVMMPDGHTFIPEGRNLLFPNMPKGTKVLPARETKGVYNYAGGVGEWFKDKYNTGKEVVGNVMDKAKDIFSYMTDPGKLIGEVLGSFVDLSGTTHIVKDMAVGMVGKVKDAMVEWAKGLFDKYGAVMGGGIGFGGWPITSPYGWRIHPISGERSFHSGVDFGAPYGAPVAAQHAGTVNHSGWMGGYGIAVKIAQGITEQLYAHLSKAIVSVGQSVAQGQIIGNIGSTGNSTGPHLHYEMRRNGSPIDPGFAVGSRYIPRDMIGNLHKGEMVVPKNENPYKNSKGKILPDDNVRQPLVIQVMMEDGRILAENIVDDINQLLGNKNNLSARGLA